MDPLASPNLKLGRAYEHYTAFTQKLTVFENQNPFTTYTQRDPLDGIEILKVRLVGRPCPDPRLGTIVGDFASNLRGALDHLVWAMSVAPKKPHRVEFPIEDTAAAFTARRPLAIGATPLEAQDLIEGLQPYKQWGHLEENALWRIKCLANADKHRTVTVVATGLHYRFGTFLPGPTAMFISFPNDSPVDLPLPRRSGDRQWLQTGGGSSDVRPAFAVVTADGLQIPADSLLGLYEFVKTQVFASFPARLFPK